MRFVTRNEVSENADGARKAFIQFGTRSSLTYYTSHGRGDPPLSLAVVVLDILCRDSAPNGSASKSS